MTRLTSPSFALFSCAVALNSKERQLAMVGNSKASTPVILRWATDPLLGFPRQPFDVYRRVRGNYSFKKLNVKIGAGSTVMMAEWGRTGMYEVRFQGSPNPGQSLIVEAIDQRGEVIPGQQLVFTSTQPGLLRASGIVALRLRGLGTVVDVVGVSMQELVNDPRWTLIEAVGLPFMQNEIAANDYKPDPQGLAPPSLNGIEASKKRLTRAAEFRQSPPSTGDPNIPIPNWTAPNVGVYLDSLLQEEPSGVIKIIRTCLENTRDDDLTNRQVEYLYEAPSNDGIRQADLPESPVDSDAPTDMKIPVVGMTILAVTSDTYAATALGYGTIDFPPSIEKIENLSSFLFPVGMTLTPFDYMVTAEFGFPFGIKQEYAALAMPRPLPETPTGFTASSYQKNRSPSRDMPTSESVKLSWDLSLLPQGYVVAESESSGRVNILNSARDLSIETQGFEPFTPQRLAPSEGAPPPNARTTFIDPVSIMPISGEKKTTYLVAGIDVFGRWSNWQLTKYDVSAPPIQKPGLHSVQILIDGNPSGRIQPCKLEIEFSWNWSDCSPNHIEFTSNFFTEITPPVFTSGFALDAVAPTEPTLVVVFNASEQPYFAVPSPGSPAPSGTITELSDSTNPAPRNINQDFRRYRMILNAFSCDFTGKKEVKFAVYAAATELVRPSFLSDRIGAVVTKLEDPIPPNIPILPIDLRWTALPDPTGRARGILRWEATPGAVGYILYEATESAVRHMIDPSLAVPLPEISLRERADQLRSMITSSNSSQDRSMLAFSRLNTDLVSQTEMELALPAASSTLYVYRIAAVNSAKVESARSTQVAIFAVPKQNVPGQPRLLLRGSNAIGTPRYDVKLVEIIASPGIGATTAGYSVFRVRSRTLLSDVGVKGPPKILPTDSRWMNTTLPSTSGVGEAAHNILDTVDSSWYPYYYQLVAIGFENINGGEYAGESVPSAIQSIVLPPTKNPALQATLISNANSKLITFQTDLPVKETPLGSSNIEITQIRIVGDRPERSMLLSVSPENVIDGGALELSDTPITTMAITRQATIKMHVSEFTVLLPLTPTGVTLTVRDPLGRITEIQL
jgi:hypothetical protein